MAFPADYATLDTDITDATTTDNADLGKDHATVHNEVHAALNDLKALLTTTGDLITFDGTNWVRVARSEVAPADAGTTLTNTSPNNTGTYQQWGTEEAVIAQADCPVSAAVTAVLTGNIVPGPGSPAVGDRGSAKLQVSFDGGATWVDMTGTVILGVLFVTTANRGHSVPACGRATGTVTGDIQVRAMVKDTDQANDTTWANGAIVATVVPQ